MELSFINHIVDPAALVQNPLPWIKELLFLLLVLGHRLPCICLAVSPSSVYNVFPFVCDR